MKQLARVVVLILLLFVIGLPGNQSYAQSQPLAVVLFEQLSKQFNLPVFNKGNIVSTNQVNPGLSAGYSSTRRTTGNQAEQPVMYMEYMQNYSYRVDEDFFPQAAICEAKVVVKTWQLSKMSADQQKSLLAIAQNGFSETFAEYTTAGSPFKESQKNIGSSTLYIISAKGSGPEKIGLVEYTSNEEKDIIYWHRGDWVFSIDREVIKRSAGGFGCGEQFVKVPDAIQWAEAVYAISEQAGFFAATPDEAQPEEIPILEFNSLKSASCTTGLQRNYPLVLSIQLSTANQPVENFTPGVRLEWSENAHYALQYQTFQEKPSYSPDFESREWLDIQNNQIWLARDNRLDIPLRFMLDRLQIAITPQTPFLGRVSVYGMAGVEDGGYSKKLAECDIRVDFVAVAYEVRGSVEKFNHERWDKQEYTALWESLAEKTLLYVDDVLLVNKRGAVNIMYIDGTMAYVYSKPGQQPFTMTITHPEGVGLLTYVLPVLADEGAEEGMERGINFLITRVAPKLAKTITRGVSFIFLAEDVYSIGNYMWQYRYVKVMPRIEIRDKATVVLGNQKVSYDGEPQDEVYIPLKTAFLDLKSTLEVASVDGSWVFSTLEGSPEVVTADGRSSMINAGQRLKTTGAAEFLTLEGFDPQSMERWWEQTAGGQDADQISPLPEDKKDNPFVGGGAKFPNAQALLLGIMGLFCFGSALLVLLVGIWRGSKLLSFSGLAIILLVVCIAGVAVLYSLWANRPAAAEDVQIGIPIELSVTPPAVVVTPTPGDTPQGAAGQLEAQGPWLIIPAQDGIWAMNQDGSGLTKLYSGLVLGPADFRAAISPQGGRLAFISADTPDLRQGLRLMTLSLPSGQVETIKALTQPGMQAGQDAEICDPRVEAARAAGIGNALAWSPDGKKLAFVGALNSSSADVFLYSLEDGTTRQLSYEAGQAHDLHWSPDAEKLLYFSATCFGTGAGFAMESAWSIDLAGTGQKEVYKISTESYAEEFVAWDFGGANEFFVVTRSGCPYRDLRMVDMDSGVVRPIFPGCFQDLAVGPTSMLAVLTNRDFSDQPGVYLYPEPGILLTPVYFANEKGRALAYRSAPVLFFVQNFRQTYLETISLDVAGKPGWYQGRGDVPFFAMDGSVWISTKADQTILQNRTSQTERQLLAGTVAQALWFEILDAQNIWQAAIFFSADDPGIMYMITGPDYTPQLLAENMKLFAEPVWLFP